ncbi:DNA repair protein RAD52 homolog isoform X2 [Bolinopsis microptera]|uniref:DNA repair protein RAD52 homolog isoform X2 n=1 Tax=Bolinopsis microptera TaxID=2820187 RepID=UPI003078FB64
MSFGSITYTDDEFNEIQAALRKRLGTDFVATRPGPGGQKLYYVEGWRVVQLANETFGFDGWGYSVTNMTVDFVDHLAGKFNVGVSATVKVTLKNGCFREDVGYGCVDGMRSKSQAVEKARKESITDGLKRAMKSFGNLMGNCLNDKDYMRYLSKTAKKPPENYASISVADTNMAVLPNSRRQSVSLISVEKPVSGLLADNAASSGGSVVNNTSTPLRLGGNAEREIKTGVTASSSSGKPSSRVETNNGDKRDTSSVNQFDKEELSNILSQDSFADFSQMEDKRKSKSLFAFALRSRNSHRHSSAKND